MMGYSQDRLRPIEKHITTVLLTKYGDADAENPI